MSQLSPYLPYNADESATSFVGRLAAFHCVPGPRLLCRMIGLTFKRIVRGEPDELRKLAKIAGVSSTNLQDGSLRLGPEGWTLREHHVGQPLRGRLRICPECLRQDAERSGLPVSAAAYGRTLWSLPAITTCPEHRLKLLEFERPSGRAFADEFHRPLHEVLGELASLAQGAERRTPSQLERYLLGRLGGRSEPSCWLEDLEWWAAAETCQALGTLAVFGRSTYPCGLTDDDLQRAGAAGFEIARYGEPSILSFLRETHETIAVRDDRNSLSSNKLGTLHHWMTRRRDRPQFGKICDVFREHLVTTRPYATGAMILGQPLGKRRFHTIHSLATELDVHHRTIEEHLVLHGLISREAIKRDGRHVLVPADEAVAAISRYRISLTLGEATAVLGLGQRQGIRAARDGLIRPIASRKSYGRMQPTYDRAEIETLLVRLFAKTRPVSKDTGELVTLDKASRMTGRSVCELATLVLDGVLGDLRADRSRPGVQGMLIPTEQVWALLSEEARTRVTRRQAAKLLHIEASAVTKLLELGVLSLERKRSSDYTRNGPGLDLGRLEEFRNSYVSASDLAIRFGVIHTQIIIAMRIFEIRPFVPPPTIGAYLYNRAVCRSWIQRETARPTDDCELRALSKKNSKDLRSAFKARQVVHRLRQAFADIQASRPAELDLSTRIRADRAPLVTTSS